MSAISTRGGYGHHWEETASSA